LPLPFDVKRELEVTISEAFADREQDILKLITGALKKEKANSVHQVGNRIEFHGGIFRPVMSWNQLVAISSGEIEVHHQRNITTLVYHIRFTQLLLLVSVMVVAFFGPFIWPAPNLDAGEALALLGFIWLWLVGGNIAITCFRFPRFLRKALKPII
jgi:hypothetical protein